MSELGFELLRPDLPRGRYKAVMFDFDGTLSLLREGWHTIMVPMMVEALVRTGTKESEAELTVRVEEFVMALNGQPTIFQMARLAEEVRARGAAAEVPTVYLEDFQGRLLRVVGERAGEIRDGRVPAEHWAVPGSHRFLAMLRDRGLKLYLASGTELRFVRPEADLLQLTPYFGNEVHAPAGDETTFSKRAVIERMIADNDLSGDQLLSFGDGVVETEEVRRVGGTAVAVASALDRGRLNQWKRDRLVAAGADLVIPDYQDHDRLLDWLFNDR
jgi:phosphoglycolate phosphatase-like HAD superfamily hydrolase